MNEADFRFMMSQFGFEEAGWISLAGEYPAFELAGQSNDCGMVYLWVEISEQTFTVVYVGKAGRTLRQRCNQHVGGFRHSSTGRAHADRLRQGLRGNKHYVIYVRKSETKDVLGESGISMAAIEELALIQKFRPSWNSL